MDDSDQDFVDLCSKLLKRVRKKPGEPRKHQPSSQASDGDKRRRNNKRDGDSGFKSTSTQPVGAPAEAEQPVACGGTRSDSGDAASTAVSAAAEAAPTAEGGVTVKDKVLLRMQQFKRESPKRVVHKNKNQPTNHESDHVHPPPLAQTQDPPESLSSGLHQEAQDSDEALALRLQQELDREAAEAQTVDLEDGGLFFCQICHRDLSHMTPERRTQHLNRCLDDSEDSAPAPPPPPPPPGVPDCPICGKKFKSQKSRAAHLKRCSSDMGVSPAVLLQALQRQAEETQNVLTANTLTQTGGSKRKGPSKPALQARKKPRNKTGPLDEDTMVALALSSSLLEQEKEAERLVQTDAAVSHISMTPVLKWRPDAGKGCGKRRKGTVPRPPPLLLIQDPEAALMRLQERVSALLLRSRPPSPPTPTHCPSSVPGWSGAAPLWQKSRLLDGGSTCLSDFYTPELREFITPWETATADTASSSTVNKLESSVQPASEGAPVIGTRTSILLSSSQAAASSQVPSTQGIGGSQALRDTMELAEDGMTLTQCGYTVSGLDKDKSISQISNLHQSGFVHEASEEQADLCASGFLPETTDPRSENSDRQASRTTYQPGPDEERGRCRSVTLSRLASDLSSMVNNPQLSDIQLQVDSGEVYFAHSFMVYARCPLLAEKVHESGFGVKEEGMPAAQRVLMNDVPGQAVFALLQYLYTGQCLIPASVGPHILELASRFDLQELQHLCELHQEDVAAHGDVGDYIEEDTVSNQTNQAFTDLLHSMWNDKDEDYEGTDTDKGSDEDGGLKGDCQTDDLMLGDTEETVNEEELEEIYEFAATQRKREEDKEGEEVMDEEKDEDEMFTKPAEPRRSSRGFTVKTLQPNSKLQPDTSLDRSYNRLFSESWGVYEEGDPSLLPSTSGSAKAHSALAQHQSPHKPELSHRTLLQSSPSIEDELSLSPQPSRPSLPVPGLSPGLLGGQEINAVEPNVPNEGLPLKRLSEGSQSISDPLSPQRQEEPELIVLSDSSEEMEVVLISRSPSPHLPCAVENLQDFYTQIKPQTQEPDEPAQLKKTCSSPEFSPDNPSAAPVQNNPGSRCDQTAVDCSPEVSWLIPSTPVQHRRSTTSSSTQTKSSMCRTQLFPKGEDASPSPSVFSSPPLTSDSPVRVSACAGRTETSVPRLQPEETDPCSSSSDLSFCPKRSCGSDVSKAGEGRAAPPCKSRLSHLSNSALSKQNTPLQAQSRPYSSTPLHTELLQPPALPATSPLCSNIDKQRLLCQGRDRTPSESPEKTDLGSFHLCPLSDPSDLPSSSSHRGLQSSQRHSDTSSQSPRSVESRSHDNTEPELTRRGIRNEEGEREIACKNKDTGDEGQQERAKEETEEAEVSESSFQHSFMAMDEPPIAFNDSWGLDACDPNPGCFSLRLEDSGGSSQQDCSSGQREKAGSSSSTNCQPPSCRRSIPLLNSRGSANTDSPPSKTHSAQTSTGGQPPSPSFTPSPPDPTARTTPEINSVLNSKLWDSWEEEDEEEALPLSQRVNPSARLKTPVSTHRKRRGLLAPITPMPHYSDMDTPELKNKLNRFGVRPLPKRQMILKLKEIHEYTHQLASSDSEDEALSAGRSVQMKPTSSVAAGSRPASCAQTVRFKEPRAPTAKSPLKHIREEEAEPLSASQGSNTSSTAASEESERSNPELGLSSDGDSDSDGGISASQAATRLQDRLQAVRSFILSDSGLYTQILQYQPLVLSQLQERLKAAGIRLGAAKLVDYLDSQCITFTTAKPGHSAPGRRRGRKTGKTGESRKRGLNSHALKL